MTISRPDQHGRITVRTDTYDVVIAPRTTWQEEMPHVMVADSVAHDADPDLAAFAAKEANLGDLRWAERGADTTVDALYDRLNERIAATKTAVAREALNAIAGLVDGDVTAAGERAMFSVHAGCRMCPCSPGVVVGSRLYIDGLPFDVWVEPTA